MQDGKSGPGNCRGLMRQQLAEQQLLSGVCCLHHIALCSDIIHLHTFPMRFLLQMVAILVSHKMGLCVDLELRYQFSLSS